MKVMRINTLLLAVLVSIGLAGAAVAQSSSSSDAEISDQELQMFVDVQQDIMAITQEYSGRLEGVEDEDRAIELQREASQLMVEAVDEIGLGVEGYNKVGTALQEDEELQARVQEMVQEPSDSGS